MKTSALIIASGATKNSKGFKPMTLLGTITAIERIILTFRQAGIEEIVLVIGSKDTQMEKKLSHFNVIILRNENESAQMLDSVKIGIKYLFNACDNLFIVPADIPLFKAETIEKMIKADGEIVNPSYNGISGHPVCIKKDVIPMILRYSGQDGLRGALNSCSVNRAFVQVQDEGVKVDIEYNSDYERLIGTHSLQKMRVDSKFSIAKEDAFFGADMCQLMTLIQKTESVRLACDQMGISYSKGWKMIDTMETQLGYKAIERKQGGKKGGKSILTKEGTIFFEKYISFEKKAKEAVENIFKEIFKD